MSRLTVQLEPGAADVRVGREACRRHFGELRDGEKRDLGRVLARRLVSERVRQIDDQRPEHQRRALSHDDEQLLRQLGRRRRADVADRVRLADVLEQRRDGGAAEDEERRPMDEDLERLADRLVRELLPQLRLGLEERLELRLGVHKRAQELIQPLVVGFREPRQVVGRSRAVGEAFCRVSGLIKTSRRTAEMVGQELEPLDDLVAVAIDRAGLPRQLGLPREHARCAPRTR